jgi:hypothetical protein
MCRSDHGDHLGKGAAPWEVGGGAGVLGARHPGLVAVGADHRDRGAGADPAQLTSGGQTVEPGHHQVHQDHRRLQLNQGVAPRVVMETLGYSAIAVTMNTYSHVLPIMQGDAPDRMNDLLE